VKECADITKRDRKPRRWWWKIDWTEGEAEAELERIRSCARKGRARGRDSGGQIGVRMDGEARNRTALNPELEGRRRRTDTCRLLRRPAHFVGPAAGSESSV
jgi:hypothetical protein